MWFPTPDVDRMREYRAAGYWRDDTIPALFASAATAAPDKVAVRDASGASLSYRQLVEESDRLAGFLAASSVGKRDIVTVCLPNWLETVVVFLAAMKRGAIVNPIPVTYGRADLAFALTKCESRALFVPGRFRSADFTVTLTQMDPAILAGRPIVRIGEGAADIGMPWASRVRICCSYRSTNRCQSGKITDLPHICAAPRGCGMSPDRRVC